MTLRPETDAVEVDPEADASSLSPGGPTHPGSGGEHAGAGPAVAAADPAELAPTMATVLRKPRFAFLVAGQTISQLGDKLHHMALIALVGAGASTNTGGFELAKLSVVFTAPVILFGPVAGALVDRLDKRAVMIVCDALRALLVVTIPWLYMTTGHLWPVYVVAFLVFLLGVFFNAAKMALIPELVPHGQLLPANAALTFIGRFATVGGIVGGGVIIGLAFWRRFGWSDYAAGFYLDATSYFISVVTLLAITLASGQVPVPRQAGARAEGRAVKRSFGSLVGDVIRTLTVIRHDRTMRFVFGSLVALALFASTVYVAMTYSVQTVMGRGTRGVGYLGGILGGGMIVGSLLVGTIGSRWDKRQTIQIGNSIIGLLMIVGGIFFSFGVFAPVAFLGGALLAPVMVSQDTMLHENAPPDARALIFSTKDLILGGVFMLSALAVGGTIYLLGRFGVEQPYRWALSGVGLVIFSTGIAGRLSSVADRRRVRGA
ncbi:MAG: MFS transporter [Gemmatimonadota bacterium]